jgi:hypothetical protein
VARTPPELLKGTVDVTKTSTWRAYATAVTRVFAPA